MIAGEPVSSSADAVKDDSRGSECCECMSDVGMGTLLRAGGGLSGLFGTSSPGEAAPIPPAVLDVLCSASCDESRGESVDVSIFRREEFGPGAAWLVRPAVALSLPGG